ncbi:helix-turn-helix domain-containing protein [Fimbriiglobus ruber]|nr:helix-turn-helix transcriptional regulator [Fimbriiglobus ruber]
MIFVAKKKSSEATPFGRRLREKRVAAGLSQLALAEKIGMLRPVIAKLETSPDANPTLDTIKSLAAALDVNPADLIAD